MTMKLLPLLVVLAVPVHASAAVVCKSFNFAAMSNETRGYLHPALYDISLENQSPPPELDVRYSADEVCATDPTFDLDAEWTSAAINDWVTQAVADQAAADAAAAAATAARQQLVQDALDNWSTISDADRKAALKAVLEYLQASGM